MDESFIRTRITQLRLQKGVSESKMSTDMGHAKNYIRNITVGPTLPSVPELLYMCEYLGVSESEFFDAGNNYPALIADALEDMKKLNEQDLKYVVDLIKRLCNNN